MTKRSSYAIRHHNQHRHNQPFVIGYFVIRHSFFGSSTSRRHSHAGTPSPHLLITFSVLSSDLERE